MDIIQVLQGELGIGRGQVEAAVRLMDEGNTIPFIARYRKEVTGSLDDAVLRTLEGLALRVPVYFVQSLSQGCRGPSQDPQLTQLIRDLGREAVIINDREFRALGSDEEGQDFASKVLFILGESVRRADSTMREWDALRLARKALLRTYRSQTGGDCFDAVSTLLGHCQLAVVAPVNVAASKNPIRISVTEQIPTVSDVGKRGGNDADRAKIGKVHM